MSLDQLQHSFLNDLARVFSGSCEHGQLSQSQEKILTNMGIDVYDLAGWLKSRPMEGGGKCGRVAFKYQRVRSHGRDDFLARMNTLLQRYEVLIEELDNYVWMNRVGIEVEKYYKNLRADALAGKDFIVQTFTRNVWQNTYKIIFSTAWEKKTDITTAINIATKKRLTLLVKELKEKLDIIGPSVSYTSVKEAKERHLGSKALKAELASLSSRRLERLKDSCVENSLSIINEWVLHEESAAKAEAKSLSKAIREIETNVRENEDLIKADGGAHLFAKLARSTSRSSLGSTSSRSGT